MKPAETIYFLIAALILLLLLVIVFLVFRKRRALALIVTSILIISYASFYMYYPNLKKNVHADRYEKLSQYLTMEYPDKKFTIVPENYEKGHFVGHFMVNEDSSPELGVELKVDGKGRVHQTSSWSNYDNLSQEELYRSLAGDYLLNYSLEDELPDMRKIDQFIDGSLTVFAMTIDENPCLAIFEYTDHAYSLVAFKEGERANYLSVEEGDYIFIYVDEMFLEDELSLPLKAGDKLDLNLEGKKGSLIIQNRNGENDV